VGALEGMDAAALERDVEQAVVLGNLAGQDAAAGK
jgi:hypothetical protein